jgi:hypothetical protein
MASRESSHNLVRRIPNLNDISSKDKHLYKPTNTYHAPIHDNNPSAVTSSSTTMTNYGKKHAIDGFQMKDSSSPRKQM